MEADVYVRPRCGGGGGCEEVVVRKGRWIMRGQDVYLTARLSFR